MLTKQMLNEMIRAADDRKLAQIVGRAVCVMFRNQTDSEKSSNSTNVLNSEGFTAADARQGSITAKYFIKHGTLLDWQVALWTKTDSRGTMRIAKYWRQLAEAAARKQANRAESERLVA